MKKDFSKSWIKSVQPRKQRKYIARAPLHIKRHLIRAHLNKELREKYGKRSISVRKGDKVKIMRGQFKGTIGKIEKVNTKKGNVLIDSAKLKKKDGTSSYYPIKTSNLMIIGLNLDDKKRISTNKKVKK